MRGTSCKDCSTGEYSNDKRPEKGKSQIRDPEEISRRNFDKAINRMAKQIAKEIDRMILEDLRKELSKERNGDNHRQMRKMNPPNAKLRKGCVCHKTGNRSQMTSMIGPPSEYDRAKKILEDCIKDYTPVEEILCRLGFKKNN